MHLTFAEHMTTGSGTMAIPWSNEQISRHSLSQKAHDEVSPKLCVLILYGGCQSRTQTLMTRAAHS